MKKLLPIGVAFVLFVSLALGAGALVQNNADSKARDIAGCHQTNVLRAAGNHDVWSDYHFEKDLIATLRAPGALAALSSSACVERLALVQNAQTYLNAFTWVTLTDCRDILKTSPAEISFSKGNPPASAFNLGPNN